MKKQETLLSINVLNRHSLTSRFAANASGTIFHFGSYFMPATEKFLEGFLPWLAFGEI